MVGRTARTWSSFLALSFFAAIMAVVPMASAASSPALAAPEGDSAQQPSQGSSKEWVEPSPVTSSQGVVVGFRDSAQSVAFIECVNELQQQSVSAGSGASWNFTPCEQPDMVACDQTQCTGHILDDVSEATYTLFDVSNSANTRALVDSCGGPAAVDCITAAGCVISPGADGVPFIGCPFSLTEVGSLTVDMASRRAKTTPSPPPSTASQPISRSSFETASTRGMSGESGSWSDRTVLSDVRLAGDPAEEAIRVAATAAVSVVLIILVMLPTQLINSTLEENDERIRGWFRRRKKSPSNGPEGAESRTPRRHPTKAARRRVPDWVWGLPILLVAAIITGFADPSFGFTLSSLRFVLTTFVTFLVLNYVGTVFVWLILRKRESAALPTIRVHYLYLVIIAVTVALTRWLEFQPALVFGVVLAIEATRVAKDIDDQRAEDRSIGRMQFAIALVTVIMGFLAWLLFNLVVTKAPVGAVPTPGLLATMVTTQEALGAFTIESLTTLPILMLPLRFMPGSLVFRWSKVAWAMTFGVVVTMFFFVLVPMPTSWSTVSMPFSTWIIALVVYAVFAVIFWAVFRFTRRSGSE